MSYAMAASELRELAKKFDGLSQEAFLPEQNLGLVKALEKLREMGFSAIHVALQVSSYNGSPEFSVKWSIWDGSMTHDGGTLDGAVASCMAKHRKDHANGEEAIQEAQRVIDRAGAERVPF